MSDNQTPTLPGIIGRVNGSDLATIRPTVSGILSIMDDPASTAKDLIDLVTLDPPLTARLLRLANSALYSPVKKIGEIEEAVIWIGFDALKELALSQKIAEIYLKSPWPGPHIREALWKHSVAVAVFARTLYRKEFMKKGSNAYAAGLLHDIGILIEDQFMHREFQDVLELVRENGGTLLEAEREVFGFTHTDVGRELAEDWGFPEETTYGIGSHHIAGSLPVEYTMMISTLVIGNAECEPLVPGLPHEVYDRDTVEWMMKCQDISHESLALICEDVSVELAQLESQGFFRHGQ